MLWIIRNNTVNILIILLLEFNSLNLSSYCHLTMKILIVKHNLRHIRSRSLGV